MATQCTQQRARSGRTLIGRSKNCFQISLTGDICPTSDKTIENRNAPDPMTLYQTCCLVCESDCINSQIYSVAVANEIVSGDFVEARRTQITKLTVWLSQKIVCNRRGKRNNEMLLVFRESDERRQTICVRVPGSWRVPCNRAHPPDVE